MKVTVIPIVIGALGTAPKGLERGLEELEIRGRIETVQTTALLRSVILQDFSQKSIGDLKKLAVTQTPVKDNQLILVWGTRKEYNNDNNNNNNNDDDLLPYSYMFSNIRIHYKYFSNIYLIIIGTTIECSWEEYQWRGTSHCPEVQYWSVIITV